MPLPPKLQGELAELLFMHKAASLGLTVSKTFGDAFKYDFIVESRRRFYRVQVKSVFKRIQYGYCARAANGIGSHKPYSARQIDFLAVYVIPLDTWWIIPVSKVRHQTNVYLRVESRRPKIRNRFARNREAWHLLGARKAPRPSRA
jgi:hypothetical protein